MSGWFGLFVCWPGCLCVWLCGSVACVMYAFVWLVAYMCVVCSFGVCDVLWLLVWVVFVIVLCVSVVCWCVCLAPQR